MGIDNLVESINKRLKVGLIPCKIERNGNFLCLRATLPPKPGTEKVASYQQRIYLHLPANELGIKEAEKEAKLVGACLIKGEFDWGRYISSPKKETKILTIGDWCDRFEADYFSRRRRNGQSETTWRTEYQSVFRKLPRSEILTEELIRNVILQTEPDTRTRKRFCMVLQALAKFAGLDCNLQEFKGKYNAKSVNPRNLPSDEDIVRFFLKIQNPSWKWIYGVIATFGLRNHEAFRLDISVLQTQGMARVTQGKTGERVVLPYYPEWIELFKLQEPIPPPNVNINRRNADIGHEVTQFFYRHRFPFKCYDLRHCWAVRTLRFNLNPSLAAKQMGHSLKIHTELYNHWIDDVVYQEAWLKSISSPLRPQSPLFFPSSSDDLQ